MQHRCDTTCAPVVSINHACRSVLNHLLFSNVVPSERMIHNNTDVFHNRMNKSLIAELLAFLGYVCKMKGKPPKCW